MESARLLNSSIVISPRFTSIIAVVRSLIRRLNSSRVISPRLSSATHLLLRHDGHTISIDLTLGFR